jgi:hypothetical protein
MLIIDYDRLFSPDPSAHNILKISYNGEQKVMQLIFIFDPISCWFYVQFH